MTHRIFRLAGKRAGLLAVAAALVLLGRPAIGLCAPAVPAPTDVISPVDASALLAVLNDPAKRAALTRTLTDLSRATKAAAPAPAGLAPNSLAAEALSTLASVGTGLAVQSQEFGKTFHDFRNLGPWISGVLATGDRRDLVFGALGRLAIVLAVAIGIAIGVVRRLIARPIAGLSRMAGAEPPPPEEHQSVHPDEILPDDESSVLADDTSSVLADDKSRVLADDISSVLADDDIEEQAHGVRQARNYMRLLHALRRVPFALLHFALELLPVIAFVAVGYVFELSGFVTLGESLFVVRAALNSFVVGGVFIAIVLTLFSPGAPTLRLLLVTDPVAHRVTFWLRVMAITGAWGFSAVSVLGTLGLADYTVRALTKVLIFGEHTLIAVLIVRTRHQVARRLRPPQRVAWAGRRILVRLANRWWIYAIFLDYALWLVYAAQLRHGYTRLLAFTIETTLVVAGSRLVAVAMLGGLERLLRVDPDVVSARPWLTRRATHYRPVLRRCIAVLLVTATAIVLLQIWGFHAFAWFRAGEFGGRVVSALITILTATLAAIVMWEAANIAIERHVEHLARDPVEGAARIARVRTLTPMLRITLMTFIAGVLVLTILSEIGVNIAPLLGGAGILGVALGFGSQKLVQDFITGMFLLLENTMQVGDTVTLAGLSGVVEHLSIRTIRLRAGDGALHTIPFSSVTTVSNSNRGLGNAAVSIDIAFDEDPDRAGDELKEIARDMRADPAYADGMLSDLQLWGVNAVSGQAVTLLGQIVCTDGARWGVQREFNRRMRNRFDSLGIALATPVQTVFLGKTPRPDTTALQASRPDEGNRAANLTESPPPSALGHDA